MADKITEPKTDVPQPEPVIPEYNTEFPVLGTPLEKNRDRVQGQVDS